MSGELFLHPDTLLREPCLVTGASGFLGRHFLESWKARMPGLTALSRRPLEGIRFRLGDLTDPALSLGPESYAIVYHLAGCAHRRGRRADDERLFFGVNVQGTERLLLALERLGTQPRAIVLVSSVAVYGVAEGELLDEDTPRRPSGPYGQSKKESEDRIVSWAARHGIQAGIIRLPMVAGRGAAGNWARLAGAIARGTYWGLGTGECRRSLVLAADVCAALPTVARVGGTFHLTDGDHPSLRDLETALAAASNRPVPRRLPAGMVRAACWSMELMTRALPFDFPFTSHDVTRLTRTLTFSDARARRDLDWRPRRVLDHIAECIP